MSTDPEQHHNRIFPRNLTAKAAHFVMGNPMNSRPEKSVENCYPGLEFDQRNIDKVFFPGLVFEMHREFPDETTFTIIQPLLRELKKSHLLLPTDIDYTGKKDEEKIYLWRIEAPSIGLNLDTSIFTDPNTDTGLSIWRYIREIPSTTPLKILLASFNIKSNAAIFDKALQMFYSKEGPQVSRDENGVLLWAILTGERTTMIDPDTGVINTEFIEPGDLTRSLCNPWQYDFRDCKCYYWASAKPDIVSDTFGKVHFLDFLRKERNHFPTVPVGTEQEWMDQELNHVDMIDGWEQLPIVLDDKEVNYRVVSIIETLRNLAPVEHALCVEYLYAYYSMDLDKVKDAADEILRIAIDEMRHFRWVNEMLGLLSAKPVINRAIDYGPAFDNRPFSLSPMTQDTLNWFTEVEKPSQSINVPGQIDGMYVRLHESIIQNKESIPQAEKLTEIIKLIIDEGDGHYHRYLYIADALKPYWASGQTFVYEPQFGNVTVDDIYMEISNKAYLLLLAGLQISFSLRESSSGQIIQFAIRSMHLMDTYNRLLAKTGRLPEFKMPPLEIFESPELIDIILEVELQIKNLKERLDEHSVSKKGKSLLSVPHQAAFAELQHIAEETISKQIDTVDQIHETLKNLKPIKNKPGGIKPSPPLPQ